MTRSAIFFATAMLSVLSVSVVHSAEVPVATGVVVVPTYDSGWGSQSHDSIATTVSRMQAILKSKIRDLRPGVYIAANKFLESLAYEARFEARPVGLASTTR